jgi:hypothetical protein
LKLNSTNNKILAGFAKQDGLIGKECHVIENWRGMKIELFVDRNVKMMGAITDGIRIKPLRPKEKVKPNFTKDKFEAAKKANATIEQIEKSYIFTKEIRAEWEMYNKEV